MIAGRDAKVERSLAEYGRYSGLAFQLVDDLLDFTASPKILGKPVLNDLKEGKVTLPLIYALEASGPAERRMVDTVLDEKGFVSVRREQISSLVRNTGAIDRARRMAQDFAFKAKACVEDLVDSDYRRALLALPDFILERES